VSAAAVDWAALRAYARSVGVARASRETPAVAGSLAVPVRRVGWYRAAAGHLVHGVGDVASAAYGGLQDSSPRAGLLGLHARLAAGAEPGSWEHPALAQIWLRRADYIVPRADVGVFTVGALPRDPAQAGAIAALAERAVAACGGTPRPTREVAAALGPRGVDLLRYTSVSGRVLLRWDASRIDLIPVDPPATDPEDARRELARRYLRWHGPGTHRQFARWAGIGVPEAARTWSALAAELVPVDLAGNARWLLAADEDALRTAVPPTGVRLLPPGDPFLQADVPALVAAAPTGAGEPTVAARTDDSRLRNSLTGRVLLDGDLAGHWGRRGTEVTIALWRADPVATERVEAAAAGLAGPLGSAPRIRWLP
jgi:Winged helix DNA-binding domain